MPEAATPVPALRGLRVAITADRKGAELQNSLLRLGADVVWGPTMSTVAPEVDELLHAETDALLAADPEWLAISTGSGLRAWLASAHSVGRGAEVEALLRRTRTVARGSKSHGALRGLGVEPVFVSAKETMDDVCSWLGDQLGPRAVLGVQLHGGEVIGSLDALRPRLGAVLTVAPYRWVLPDDVSAAQDVVQQIIAGTIDAVAQTSAPSARNLLEVAAGMGRRAETIAALRRPELCVAAVGAVTARAFEEVGVAVDVMPQRPRTADLLRALVHWATVRRGAPAVTAEEADPNADRPGDPDALELVPAATAVRIGPHVVRLGRQEFAVLAAMVRRPGVVLKPEDLALQAWGHRMPDDAKQVRHQVSRIRRKLGPHADVVQTVRNVGYRYRPPGPADPP